MSLCPMECRGRKNEEIKGTSLDRPEVRKGRGWLRETSSTGWIMYLVVGDRPYTTSLSLPRKGPACLGQVALIEVLLSNACVTAIVI